MSRPFSLIALLISTLTVLQAGLSPSALSAQERYQLTVPGEPALTSSAVLTQTELRIRDPQGQEFVYVREPQLDSADGRYAGFYSAATQQSLRWPTTGNGSMSVGDANGGQWRESRQQVQPVVPAGPVIRPGPAVIAPPVVPPGAPDPLHPGVPVAGVARGGYPTELALGSDRAGMPLLALVNEAGRVNIFERRGDSWRLRVEVPGPDLVPGASLALAPDIVPRSSRIYTVNARGTLVQLSPGQSPRPALDRVLLTPGGRFVVDLQNGQPQGFLVDAGGRTWNVDLSSGAARPVEQTPGLFPGGAPLALQTRPVLGRRPQRELLAISSRGDILRLVELAGGWSPPELLAEGFVPGGAIGTAWLDLPGGKSLAFIASVDWRGQLLLLTADGDRWDSAVLDVGTLPPGAPVTVRIGLDGVSLCAVGQDGGLRVWQPGIGGVWTPALVSYGFPAGAPVVVDPASGELLAVDLLGRIVPAHFHDGAWHCRLCHPGFDVAPRLISRQVVPSQPLPPARVTLVNGSNEELTVQIADALDPAASAELSLPARGTIVREFQRDAGAVLEEVYAVPDAGGVWREQAQRYPLPPQPRYSLVVWANRTAYQYIDRRPNRPAGAKPNFDLKSHVSIGVFDLPPGELLQDGATIDVFGEATANRNPGAAAGFEPPAAER
jgi:hypothetical protein